tara:strand:- start:1757 stop:2566 length:810 start_codon:yes stop_codon:yes gene_type:complete
MNKKQVISLAIIAFLVSAALLYASNGVGSDGTYRLTAAQKEEIDKLFEKSDIIALGTLKTGAKPSLSSFAMHIEEILKLSPEFEEKRKDILENPISAFSFSYPSNTPNYFTKENIGKPFLLYGSFSISDKFPNGSSVAHKAYVIAKQEDIEKAKADIVFLGKSSDTSWDMPSHYRFRTVTLEVIKIWDQKSQKIQKKLTEDAPKKITVRFQLHKQKDKPSYRLNVGNVAETEKFYWIAADKIPDTDHYDGEVIGTELSAGIAYLRRKIK